MWWRLTNEQNKKKKKKKNCVQARREYGGKAQVDGTELMQGICDNVAWKRYTPEMAYGCRKILAEYQPDVFGTFNGKHAFGDEGEIYDHKTRVRLAVLVAAGVVCVLVPSRAVVPPACHFVFLFLIFFSFAATPMHVRTQVCTNIGACKPFGMVISTLKKPTACGACRAVAQVGHATCCAQTNSNSHSRTPPHLADCLLVCLVCDTLAGG